MSNPEQPSKRPSLRELEVLRAMIEAGKTTAAAAKLGITQPAVSRAIAQLERRTGLSLFQRENGRLAATADALALQAQSEPIFQTFERLEKAGWRPEESVTLRFAVPPTLAHWFCVPLLADFLRVEPDTRVQIEIGSSIDVVTGVADGTMDLGMMDSGSLHPGIRFVVFRTSEAHVILPASSPLAARAELGAQDFQNAPFIALTRRFPSRTMLDRIFLGADVTPNIVMEVSTAASAYEFVRAGMGITILNPFPLAFRQPEDIVFRPFRPTISYNTAFILPAMTPPRPVARRFIEFVRAHQPPDAVSVMLR